MAEDDNANTGPDDDKPTDDALDDNANEPDNDDGDDDSDKAGRDGKGGRSDDTGNADLEKLRRQLRKANREAASYRTKVKEFEDKDKSESQRLTEAAEEAKSRASAAEQTLRKLQTAVDRAPEGATLAQIRAVAKRLHGETDEELEEDADEMFGLLTVKSTTDEKDTKKSPPTKPKAKLRGGGNPEEEPEEMDPRKLADLIGRF